jgi:hypothetical protein
MKYLLLAYGRQAEFEALSKADLAKLGEKAMGYDAEMKGAGRYLAGMSLDWSCKSLKQSGGTLSVTDGPYVDTKEVVGGVVIFEADGWDDAVRLAKMHPAARMGEELGWGIELRQIGHCEAIEAALAAR